MDIEIQTEETDFKYRVSGILLNDDKILTVRMCKNKFYCLPGGHVETGEDTKETIIREMKEESGYDVEKPQLIAVTENFFLRKNKKKIHELGFYYILKVKEGSTIKGDYTTIEHDKDGDIELEFKWVAIDELENIVFQPEFIKKKLVEKDFKLTHHIIHNL